MKRDGIFFVLLWAGMLEESNGLDFSDDCTECAQIAAANAVAAASMHSRCKVPPNCVSIQYRKGATLLFYQIEP